MTETSFYNQWRDERLQDPTFKAEYERQLRRVTAIDAIINGLDELRIARGINKAELARAIDKNPAAVRRLLTAKGNPELGTVVAMADVLDADVVIVPRKKLRRAATAA